MIRFDCSGIPADSIPSAGQLDAAADFFIKEGYVVLDNVLPRATVADLHREFVSDYAGFLREDHGGPSRDVGERRYLMSLRFRGGFAAPAVFANPYALSVVRKVLDETAILEAYGCVLSLPGSPTQHEHYDGPHLFGTRLSALLPPFALTCALPLVEMNEEQGTTLLRPGSHRWTAKPDGELPSVLPVVPPGSCMMWDYRLWHFGTANRSDQARPMLYCTYARPWYRDPVNFLDVPQLRRLDFEQPFLDTLPDDTRRLLAHAREVPPVDRFPA